jgi:glutathione S-transferase
VSSEVLTMIGAPGSPYSRKLRAVLRYRRIPYVWVQAGGAESRGLPKPRVDLLPQLILRGKSGALEARVDSTPLIRELESLHPGRSVIPTDPVVAFLDALLEDYADEWLTKAMFHYRWAFKPDIAKASAILPRWRKTDQPESEALALGKIFAERQIGRLRYVGSNATTGAVIEESYRRLLGLFAAQLERSRFLMGGRPGSSDFAFFGQLTQLAGFDPTSAAVALELAPRVMAWVEIAEELSGLEPADRDWVTRDAIPETLRALLGEVGRVYAPLLLANAAALSSGAESVECTIDGRPWVMQPFPYQGKCLQWLREGRAALSADDRRAVDAVLSGTGCEKLFVD